MNNIVCSLHRAFSMCVDNAFFMLMSIKNLQIPQVDQPTMSHFSAAAQMLSKLFSEVTRL